ncbi:acyl-CoA dehydrogenase family protein [Novosphingobium sp. PhB165]|uniref:acyl-CoA dehydrogenase family protein n=1 Tax=Novosphingobium sp. PhB165 TaxID=2485105 RepID=UPI001404874A|nr:acyl-CoA dehydrogenase family protein [Novosphingobium sp. PhB165]
MKSLHEAGYLSAFADLRDAAQVDDLFQVLRLIGGADLSLGRVFEGHVNAIQLIHAYGSRQQKVALAAELFQGCRFGVWNTDLAGGTWLEPIDRGWILRGSKRFATGAGHIERVLISAALADGAKQLVLVDVAGQPERADNRGWRVRGMRGSQSGLFDFDGMEIAVGALLGAPGDYEREPRFSAGAWRFAAVQLGAVESLLRHWRVHLLASGKAQDPVQRARFGQSVAATRSAASWVSRAARAAEATEPEAVPLVLMTRGVVEDAAFGVMEGAARAVGTAAFFEGSRIDRITRDLSLYLRQPVPDQARDRAAAAWLEADCWGEDAWW